VPAGLFGPLTFDYSFYNQGGGVGTDTVNALLTPGEVVINATAARSIGYGFLQSLNSLRVSPNDMRAMMSPPAAPQPRRFAAGGIVTGPGGSMSPAPAQGTSWKGYGDVTVNINASAADLYSVENVRRYLLPVLREFERRGK
jgi:hypothetical protein